jgi:[FeFe] hydrogenase H-cluster maturation GTPase HydF
MSIIVERDIIGIFGKMNAGKSSLLNLITQQETSIVDSTAGTTTDTKIALFEIHGLGPVKLLDTAGADESNILGEKKRKKVFNDLNECDLIIIIIDPSTDNFETEQKILDKARQNDKQILIVYNLFDDNDKNRIELVEQKLPILKFYKKISIHANQPEYRNTILDFILNNFQSWNKEFELLPFLENDEYYVLIIPMDDETPSGRFLRPQAMVEEYITRHWAYPVSFRLNLKHARNKNESQREYLRFDTFLNNFKKPPKAIITDSQAMDIMSKWCPAYVMITTFSITMINYVTRGKLSEFVKGITALDNLLPGDKVLIAEACNHSRIGEDIGTVQIPAYFKKQFPDVIIEHNFGREFIENQSLSQYKLIIHCGGCMISTQKMLARINELESIGVPFTNYGVLLSYMQGETALKKVLQPWGLSALL